MGGLLDPASPLCVVCGAELVVPDRTVWDVRTAIVDGAEVIVERHVTITCTRCGSVDAPQHPDTENNAELVEHGWSPHQRLNLLSEPVDPPQPVPG